MPLRFPGSLLSFAGCRRTGGLVLAGATAVLLFLPGCGESPLPVPTDRTGIIQGRIHDGGDLDRDRITIHAESPYGVDPSVRVSAHPDDDGWFQLVVPEGLVRVRVDLPDVSDLYWSTTGPTPYPGQAEAIQVDGGVRNLDFACGRLSASIALPAALTGADDWWAYLVPVDDPDRVIARQYDVVETDLDVALSLVPPGEYYLQVSGSQESVVFLPASFDTTGAVVLTVGADDETVYACSLADIATISGTVTGSWQTLGFESPTVVAYHGDREVASARADADGSFTVELLAGGAIRLQVVIAGIGRWVGGESSESATVHDLEPGQTVTGIAYVESGLACTYDPSGPIPEHMHEVVLYNAAGVIFHTTHWRGPIRLPNLPPGDVFLKVSGWSMFENWFTQYWDRRSSLAEATPITIPAGGGVANVTITLVRGGQVLGTLLDAEGRPLSTEDMFLMVYAPTDSTHVVNLYTNWDFEDALYDGRTGDYVLTQLHDGGYKMRARAGNTPWTWWPGKAGWDSAGVFTIQDATDLHDVDWRLLY